ncbi:MAG: SIS domain-containing protein [Endomicrobium sp.]|jgi:arabinose-5-phosphate isomerase|nr:SIS domain-containing protein [Endomicrobium sp.]
MRKFKLAEKIIELEAQAIKEQVRHLDSNFNNVIYMIKKCTGHVVIMGIGKSGLVGKKISATMSSVGIPSIFLHPTECLHGDLGTFMKNDIVIILSYSGETEEIKNILPILRKMKMKIIAITGHPNASIWHNSDYIINCYVTKEACPHNFTPTSSTIAMLAMGDALAITVSNLKKIKVEYLSLLHPSGAVGKKLIQKK